MTSRLFQTSSSEIRYAWYRGDMTKPDADRRRTVQRMAHFALRDMENDPLLQKEYMALTDGDNEYGRKNALIALIRLFTELLDAGLHPSNEYGYECSCEHPRKARDADVPIYEMKGKPPLPLQNGEGMILLQLRSYGSEPETWVGWHIVHHTHIKRTLKPTAGRNMKKALNDDQDRRIGDAIEQYRRLPAYTVI